MTDNIGRIIGNDVREIMFRASFGTDIFLGEILVANDPATSREFLLRIFDIRMGFEASDQDWAARTAGNMLTLEEGNIDFDLHDQQRRLYKVGVCKSLGYVENGIFKKPKTMPAHFGGIRRADREDLQIIKDFMGDVHIGRLRSGEKVVDIPVGVHSKDFSSHVGVFATTGMGKSNLMKRLAASCLEDGSTGLLIFDPHGEYYDGGEEGRRGLIHHPESGENLKVYSARELSGPFNPIKISSKEIEVDDLLHLYDFSGAQRDALPSAKRVFRDKWVTCLHDLDVGELAASIENTHEATLGVIKRKLKNLFSYNLLHRDPKVSITSDILSSLREGRTVLVDTSCMGEAEELLVSIVIARSVFEYYKDAYARPERFKGLPPVLITMEEAQRVLGQIAHGERSKRRNIFTQIAREGRKFKVGLCAVSQQPKLIDEEILSQFNTLFILGLADRKDREILKYSAKQDVSGLGTEIQMLMPGEALITSPSAPFALPVKIDLYEDYMKGKEGTPEEVLDDEVKKGSALLDSFF